MSEVLCLALPEGIRRSSLRWLVAPGETIDAGQPIAQLLSDGNVELRFPSGVRGTLRALLLDEGASAGPGNPLLTFMPDNHSASTSDRRAGLAEEAVPYASPEPRSIITAEVTDMKRVRSIAAVGLISLLGLATTVVTSLLYIVFGGTMPLLVGALALAVVAVTLLYGKRHLHGRDGFPG